MPNGGGRKPCLHGSDAHKQARVGRPDLDRYCWIKGDLSFESLRQACIEPDGRALVDTAPPAGALASQTIAQVEVTKANWLATKKILLNPGLVAIIGARGSGKTALADFIAAAGSALSQHLNDASFIRRAEPYLLNSASTLTWQSGEDSTALLAGAEDPELTESPRVQYLSQQFVEQLCSAEGLQDELLAEIERVIFQSHPVEDRLGASSFRELLEIRSARARNAREHQEKALLLASQSLTTERARKASLPTLTKQWEDKKKLLEKDKAERKALSNKSTKERLQRLEEISLAVDAARLRVEEAKAKLRAVVLLQDAVKEFRGNFSPAHVKELQKKHSDAALTAEQWKSFRLVFAGDVDSILSDLVIVTTARIKRISGPAKNEVELDPKSPPPELSLIPAGVSLSEQTLSLLDKELSRLRMLVGIDKEKTKRFNKLSEKIAKDESSLARLAKELDLARLADNRIKELLEDRKNAYAGVFDAILEEEQELSELYGPLKANLRAQGGELGKLSFSIRRLVDVEAWAAAGESHLDLRKLGPFKGQGTLEEVANLELLPAWARGTSAEVASAMAGFRDRHEQSLIEHAPVDRGDRAAFMNWARSISDWLYGTSHIQVSYGLEYGGVEIEQLSPGTRGIVLLLLYVAIDTDDDRPLIIDQPEENLDPKSIYEDLVDRFKSAKLRRQIILITHNANLVVNTDADQVIVARCGPHRPGYLPELSYESGGLENPSIRRHVCEILEGGEAAFRERAKRLRVRI